MQGDTCSCLGTVGTASTAGAVARSAATEGGGGSGVVPAAAAPSLTCNPAGEREMHGGGASGRFV